MHGGANKVVKAKAAVRAEVAKWVLGAPVDDPGDVLLRLVTQSRMRVDAYSEEIGKKTLESESLEEALIGDAYGDQRTKIGEYIKGLVVLEAQERERLASFAAKAISAGLAERQVRVAERQGELIANILNRIMDNPVLGLTAEQRKAFPVVIREQMALSSGASTRPEIRPVVPS